MESVNGLPSTYQQFLLSPLFHLFPPQFQYIEDSRWEKWTLFAGYTQHMPKDKSLLVPIKNFKLHIKISKKTEKSVFILYIYIFEQLHFLFYQLFPYNDLVICLHIN